MPRVFLATLAALLVLAQPAAAADKELIADAATQLLLRPAEFQQVVISPDGRLLAIERYQAEGSMVTIHRRDTMAVVAGVDPGKGGRIGTLRWLDNARLIVGVDKPSELYGVSFRDPVLFIVGADGKDTFQLPGNFVATIDGDPDHLLVEKCGTGGADGEGCVPEIRRADINKLRRVGELVIAGPQGSALLSDDKGNVRFAMKWEDDGSSTAYVHVDGSTEWKVINDGSKTGLEVTPLGVARDGKGGYLQSQRKKGPDTVERYDFATGKRTDVFVHPDSDPIAYLSSLDDKDIIGAVFGATRPHLAFWNDADPDAVLMTQLQKAFPGKLAVISSVTSDGQLAVVFASGDNDPGTFYLFDRKARKASMVARRMPWIDPKAQATQRAFEFTARDGQRLEGILTLPPGSSGKNLPLVVSPHGGPYDVFDAWGYDYDSQILAQHGYAVLQVNFRGSGSYGREFTDLGTMQWGRKMQDDITDATRWAITSGVADAKRMCIYGASYGGYAALMGVIREPDLYRCAVGVSGVFDLSKMYKWGSIRRSDFGKLYLKKVIGEDQADLAARSPVNLADKITVPVLLVHGRLDARVDVKHARLMKSALQKGKHPVTLIEYPYTGHSIIVDGYRRDFYAHLLQFLDENLAPPNKTAVAGAK
jgi:dipeptidyl aminopeptidase/acylaminoacyl peptidase